MFFFLVRIGAYEFFTPNTLPTRVFHLMLHLWGIPQAFLFLQDNILMYMHVYHIYVRFCLRLLYCSKNPRSQARLLKTIIFTVFTGGGESYFR